jgi:pyridoxine 4-dehydrogenase
MNLLTDLARPQHSLMMMTWRPTPIPDEEAFAAIKAGIDTLPPGMKMFLNSGGWALFDTARSVTLNLHVLLQPSSMDKTWALRIWS